MFNNQAICAMRQAQANPARHTVALAAAASIYPIGLNATFVIGLGLTRPKMPAPIRRYYGKGRSMVALATLAGFTPRAIKRTMAANYARHLAGLPLVWPRP